MIPEIQAIQKELESSFQDEVKNIDEQAVILYNQSPADARQFLTEYSKSKGKQTFQTWKNLYGYLFTKYMDGNIKTKVSGQMNPKVNQPGYSKEFYKIIVKETGDKFRVKEENSH